MPLTVESLRKDYQNSINNPRKASAFWEKIKDYKANEGIVLAYKASALALRAKHDWNPYNKLNWLNETMNIFREAIQAAPKNIEIRFLRFAIQHYLPEFLNQSQNLESDKKTILNNLSDYQEFNLDTNQLSSFHDFFVNSKRFSREELAIVSTFIEQNT